MALTAMSLSAMPGQRAGSSFCRKCCFHGRTLLKTPGAACWPTLKTSTLALYFGVLAARRLPWHSEQPPRCWWC
ncbi:unnamed protein product, partial [Symbiodinium pilosum]